MRRTVFPPTIPQLGLNEDEVSTTHLEGNLGFNQEGQRAMEADGVDSGGSDLYVQSEPDVDKNTDKGGFSGKEQKDTIHCCSKLRHKGKSNLDAHMKTHSCPKCGETFSTRVLLEIHRKNHQEIFNCTECIMQFQYRSQLKIHMRKHTGEKRYGCPICGKKFSLMGITQKHMLVHAEEKPFSCNDCGKTFSWQYQVKSHTCSRKYMYQIKSRQPETVRKESLDGDLTTLLYKRSNVSVETEDTDNDFWKETRQHQSGVTYKRNKRHSLSEKEHVITKNPLNSSDDTVGESKNADSVDLEFSKQIKSVQSGVKVQVTGKASISDAGSQSDERHRSSENSKGSEDSSYPDTDDNDFWKETRQHQSGVTYKRNKRHSLSEKEHVITKNPLNSSDDTVGESKNADSVDLELSKQIKSLLSDVNVQVTGKASISDAGSQSDERHRSSENSKGSEESHTLHIRSHIRCSVCNAVFSDADSLVLHMRSHTVQTRFQCSVCNQEFAWRRHLIKHLEVHNKKRKKTNYAYEQDEIDAPQCSDFKYSGGNSFRCPVCHASFSDKELFDQHTAMHTRTTQHCDSFCCNDLTQKQHLVKQISVQENENIYKEFYCQKEHTHHHCVNQSSNPDADLQPKIDKEASDSSDPDTDDSDFWKKTRTDLSGDQPGKRKVFKSGLRIKCVKPLEYFKPQSDDSVDTDFWKEAKKTQSNLTSDKTKAVSDCESKMAVQQFLYREDLTHHKTFYTEVQREVKQEDVKPPQIKEEKEETAVTNFTFSPVPVKTEEDEEKPQCSQHHHSHTEVSRDSLRGPEAAKNSDQTFGAGSFKSDKSVDSDFCKETRESHSGLQSETDDCKNAFSAASESAARE